MVLGLAQVYRYQEHEEASLRRKEVGVLMSWGRRPETCDLLLCRVNLII
jgi:hypothetical protein